MLLQDFEDAIDEYGTDLKDWPEGLRVAALALMERSAEARQFLEDEIRLDAALTASVSRPVAAPAGLADRIALKAFEASPAPVTAKIAARPRVSVFEQAMSWARTQFSDVGLRYAAILLFCFAGGVATSQLLTDTPDDSNPEYISGLYADLAY